MIIIKILTPKLFIKLLIMITITNVHQLYAMEPEKINTINPIAMEADFQAYKLLSTLNNDHQYYLLPELVQIITTNVSKLIDKECYQKHGTCLESSKTTLQFIEHSTCDGAMSDISIANIIKRCLHHSKKSLSEIKSLHEGTVFHDTLKIGARSDDSRVKWIKILNLAAEGETWNMICTKDKNCRTVLHFTLQHDTSIIKEILSIAPNAQNAWDLILVADKDGDTALTAAKMWFSDNLKILESYRPKKQQI